MAGRRQVEAEANAKRGPAEGDRGRRSRDASADGARVVSHMGNRAAVQRLDGERQSGAKDLSGASIDAVARRGAAGGGGALPFLERIQASFGRHDLSHVRAHTGPEASAASRALAARAYTRGSSVVFGRTPDLRTTAHEAAHVIQQRAGVHLKGEIGEAGDAHERHADAVAEQVVRGRSAEALLDRYASWRRPGAGTPVIQRWGEPDHYAMGQRAGVKVGRVLDDVVPEESRSYRLGDDEHDHTMTTDFRGSESTVVVDELEKSEKFFLRGPEGDPMSLGAANRFAGDFTKKPLESEKAHVSPSLDMMPKKIAETYEKEPVVFQVMKSPHLKREYLKVAGETMLMATNANHFFPLSTIEYRRQHAQALQKAWVARRLWARGEKLAASGIESERQKAESVKKRAEEVFRQASMVEGFAGHFLADCFAAGHLAPHALGRIGDKSPVIAGARVNTWHDLFNALPDGIPTTLGTFHGDYSMDGHDLEYVSSVIAESLLEVMMPWYTGRPYDGNVATPAPDIAAIRADPVAGPLWRTMCGDYEGFFEKLKGSSGRRRSKMSLSKYIIYATSAGSGVSKDEIMPMIAEHVFGGEEGLERTDVPEDGRGIRGKIHTIVAALHQVLNWKSGVQEATGLGQNYRPVERSTLKPKYLLSLRSRQLAKVSPAANPRKALIDELQFWLDAWQGEMSVREVDEGESALYDKVLELRGLGKSILSVKQSHEDEKRERWVEKIAEILEDFQEVDGPVAAPLELVPQGYGAESLDTTSSGIAVRTTARIDDLEDINFDLVTDLSYALHALVSDPRPRLDVDHDELYDSVIGTATELETHLMATYKAAVAERGPSYRLYSALSTVRSLVRTLRRLKAQGKRLVKIRKETFRRDAIRSIREVLTGYFTIDNELLMATTGRKVT